MAIFNLLIRNDIFKKTLKPLLLEIIAHISKIDDLKKLIEMVAKHKHCVFTPIKADSGQNCHEKNTKLT